MGGCFDGPPILAGGEGEGVDRVHDAFVVSGGSEDVELGEPVAFEDSPGEREAGDGEVGVRVEVGEQGDWQFEAGGGQSGGREVGEDFEQTLAARQLLQKRVDVFQQRVGLVGPHALAHVHHQLDHQKTLPFFLLA